MDVYKAGNFTILLFGPFIPKFRKIHNKMGWGGRFHNFFMPITEISVILMVVWIAWICNMVVESPLELTVAYVIVGVFFFSLFMGSIGWMRLIGSEYKKYVLTHLAPNQRKEWLAAGGETLIPEKKWNEYSDLVDKYRLYLSIKSIRPWWWEDNMSLKRFLSAYKEWDLKKYEFYKELSYTGAWMDWYSYVCNPKEYNKTDEERRAESDKEFKDL